MANPAGPKNSIRRNRKQKELTIDFSEINRAIKIMTNYDSGFYDPMKRSYFLDGFELTEVFINETMSKLSHYINAVSNMRLDVPIGSIEAFNEAKKQLAELTKKEKPRRTRKTKKPEKENKDTEGPIVGGDGEPITYG